MRVCVTGSDGFIGSHLCELLVARGHNVVGLGLGRTLGNLATLLGRPGFRFTALDLTTEPPPPSLAGADALIHCAALAGTARSWERFDDYLAANVLMTWRLVEACRETGPRRFIYVSSSSVYGADVTGPEDSPLAPISPYGVTKLAAEHLCRTYAGRDEIDLTIVRPFSVYGPRQRPDMMIHITIEALLRGLPLTVEGTGQQERSFTYVGDLVEGIARCLEAGQAIGQTYNLGGGELHSLLSLIQLAEKATGQRAKLRDALARPGDQYRTRADTRVAKRDLDWQPTWTLERGLDQQVTWQRSLLKREAPCIA